MVLVNTILFDCLLHLQVIFIFKMNHVIAPSSGFKFSCGATRSVALHYSMDSCIGPQYNLVTH